MKGVANALTTASNSVGNYIISASFLLVTETVTGKILGCLFMSLSCILGFFLTKWYSPETFGRTNEECVALF